MTYSGPGILWGDGAYSWDGTLLGGPSVTPGSQPSPAFVTGDRFTIYAYDLVPNVKIAELPGVTFGFTDTLNLQGSFSVALPVYHELANKPNLLPGATSIVFDDNGVIRYAGIEWEFDVDADEAFSFEVRGEGYWSYFKDGDRGPRRTIQSQQGMANTDTTQSSTQVTFAAVDMFDIVADLTAHAESVAGAGDVGFYAVRFNGPAVGGRSGILWNRTYYAYERKGIGEAIEEIGKTYPGFDFAVNVEWDFTFTPPRPRRYLDLYYPRRGIARSGVVLEHGKNVVMLRDNCSARGLANPVTGIGAGTGDAVLTSEQFDGSLIYPSGRFPYLEGQIEAHEEAFQTNLDARTRGAQSRTKTAVDAITLQVSPAPDFRIGDISVGDSCRLICSLPGSDFEIDDWYRVMQQKIEGNSGGLTTWELMLAPDTISTGIF